jgi:thiol-disulfide isomerase/thioredoxin
MRFLVNGVLLVIILYLVLDALGMPFHPPAQPVSAAQLPADMQGISATELSAEIRATGEEAKLFLLYASWCPYCKKQIAELEALTRARPELEIIAVSVDQQPEALRNFLQSRPAPGFNTRIFTGPGNIGQIIQAAGGAYQGGVPYNAVLQQGRIKSQIMGYATQGQLAAALR